MTPGILRGANVSWANFASIDLRATKASIRFLTIVGIRYGNV